MAKNYQVAKDEESGKYNGACTAGNCEFTSFGWERRKDAVARMDQHYTEHTSGEPMPELGVFMGAMENDAEGVSRTNGEQVTEEEDTE